MNSPKFKYDVGFSFLAQDEDIAMKITELLKDRLEVFIYSNRQKELAGTDGEKTFNTVFGEEARIVFVLYRKGWGATAWTRIEETAIRNRAFSEGYDFVLFAPLDSPLVTPDWLPKNRIWIGLDRWGIEGAASVIEARVREVGGTPREESIQDRAARLSRAITAEKKKQSFLYSETGVQTANKEAQIIFSELSKVVSDLSGAEYSFKVTIETARNQCAIHADNFTLFLYWSVSFGNTLESSAFYVSIWNGYVGVTGSGSFPISKPIKLKEIEFSFDLTSADKPAWREVRGDKKLFSTTELGKFAITMLLNKIQENQKKK